MRWGSLHSREMGEIMLNRYDALVNGAIPYSLEPLTKASSMPARGPSKPHGCHVIRSITSFTAAL
jgi:hypothetical protein